MSLPHSPYGFVRVAVCAPELRVADVETNSEHIAKAIREAARANVQVIVFPELCLTSYSCADLFYQKSLQTRATKCLQELCVVCKDAGVAALVGLPLVVGGRLYNAAVLIGSDGNIAGIVPKNYLPNTNEFYEARWFSRGDCSRHSEIALLDREIPFGSDLLFQVGGFPECIIGIEICEDLWACNPPSGFLATAGASLLLNPSASNEVLGKSAYRRDLVRQQSARCLAVYAYAGAGPGESSTDLVYSGHCMIAENGLLLGETERFSFQTTMIYADVDMEKISHERTKNSSFSQARSTTSFRRATVAIGKWSAQDLARRVERLPFVPSDPTYRAENCREIFSIQSAGLAKRLLHTGAKVLVVGLSGGLDSTLAALVAVHAFDQLVLERSGLIAVSMPGFGTTNRTRGNADSLAHQLGVTFREISIVAATRQHLQDISHPVAQRDVTYENAQARERTQVLMDIANQAGGFVLGTGDLSELALGWCTFNGDHMSMYHVNAGVPKTLVRYLIEWSADELFDGDSAKTLQDICQTPISPELLPPSDIGEIAQKTEDVVGPYELHDFFLYHFVRNGFAKQKILYLAAQAFKERPPLDDIASWLDVFYGRFYSQQFKRSAMPDGPKVGSVALSPRGDWRMPSDAACVAHTALQQSIS